MIGPGVNTGPTGGVPSITLPQKHIPKHRPTALRLQPPNRLRQAILALPHAQVPNTLRHPLNVLGPPNPVGSTRPIQPRKHRITSPHLIRALTIGRPTFLHHHSLVLRSNERDIIVLYEAALELHGAPTRLGAEGSEMGDGSGHTRGAVRHGHVGAALVEPVDDVLRARAHDGVLVVGGVRG